MQKKILRSFAIAIALSHSIVAEAQADEVRYVFDTPTVANGDVSRKAKDAVKGLTGVTSVDADKMKKSVSVTFDDDKLSVSDIVIALGSAGCSVSTYKNK